MIRETITQLYVIIIAVACLITACKNKILNQDISKTKIKHSMDLVSLDGSLIPLADSFYIYCSGNKIVYQLPYTYTMENDTAVSIRKIRYSYLVYKKGSLYGDFNSSAEKSDPHVNVDSLLSLKVFTTAKFYNKESDSLIETTSSNNGNILIEKYISRIKIDQSYPDTVFFYYSDKFKDVDYSFSTILDQKMKKKVFKFRMVYNSQFYKDISFKMPRREFLFEMEECPLNKSDAGLTYFRDK